MFWFWLYVGGDDSFILKLLFNVIELYFGGGVCVYEYVVFLGIIDCFFIGWLYSEIFLVLFFVDESEIVYCNCEGCV